MVELSFTISIYQYKKWISISDKLIKHIFKTNTTEKYDISYKSYEQQLTKY